MSDWEYLNGCRVSRGRFATLPSAGFNGMFLLRVTERKIPIKVIASDGYGWQHVSVSQSESRNVPTWEVMCAVKDLFWEPEDWVIQFHPAKSKYVNNHLGVLHLWKPLREYLPTPPVWMVGFKELGELK